MKAADWDAVEKVLKPADFNDYSIKVVGKHVTIKLNGLTTVDDDFPKLPDEGKIAWQLHSGFDYMEVTFKDVEFKDLTRGEIDRRRRDREGAGMRHRNLPRSLTVAARRPVHGDGAGMGGGSPKIVVNSSSGKGLVKSSDVSTARSLTIARF